MRWPDVVCQAQLTQPTAGVKPARRDLCRISVSALMSLISHMPTAHEATEIYILW